MALLLFGFALAVAIWPRLLAWPIAALAIWIGLALASRYLRRRARRASAKTTAAADARPARETIR
jgi:cardiolipin synthase